MSSKRSTLVLLFTTAALCSVAACRKKAPEPESKPVAEPAQTTQAASSAAPTSESYGKAETTAAVAATPPPTSKVAAKPVKEITPNPDDPAKGKFSLDEATKGLTGKGKLTAEIDTELGKLECELYDDKAPITVANFIGLARGLRPWKNPEGQWVKKPAYDGTTFHRVIKGFMIQGGDAAGNGSGEPGYVIPDEIWEGAQHNQRGQLCMANRGPNTNGQQFFIMDGVASHLDGGYTIFGKCSPDTVIEKLSSVEVRGDRSVNATKIKKITIKRK